MATKIVELFAPIAKGGFGISVRPPLVLFVQHRATFCDFYFDWITNEV